MNGLAAAKDLTAHAPRGLDADPDGYAWLPRMLDKARATLAGTAGHYLFVGQPRNFANLSRTRACSLPSEGKRGSPTERTTACRPKRRRHGAAHAARVPRDARLL
jgi:hypothetical protein